MLLELALLATLANEPRIITCTVGDSPTTAPLTCVDDDATLIGPIPAQWRAEWELVAPLQNGRPNTDAPLTRTPLKPGQKVKLLVEDDGLTALPTCEVRIYRRVKAWRCGGREGERVPNILYTSTDEDCQKE